MRFQLTAAAGILIVIFTAAAAEKDTAAAANTRKKLVTKVTVDFKDEHLSECLKEIARQIDEASGAKMSFFYDSGVSQNQRLTYSGKDQSVADVLDGMLKKNSLGYVVLSKEKDRYDGWLKIKQGNERGFPSGEEPKGKPVSKEPEKTKATADRAANSDEEKAEKAAGAKLEFARSLLRDGKTDKAKSRLEEIIKSYPATKAADEAKKELEKLGK